MAKAPPIPLPFDQVRQQIESATAALLQRAPETDRNALLPVTDLKRGETTVEIELRALGPSDFFALIETVGPYFSALLALRPSYRGASFMADVYSEYDRRRNASDRIKINAEELPAPTRVGFACDREGKGKVTFTKASNLVQEEVNAIVEVFGKLGIRPGAGGGGKDPESALGDLGAVVFHASEDFGWDRVAGYEPTKQEVRETIVLPLNHPEIFEAVTNLSRTRPGSSVPRAVLFEGPPGTGKTTMARVMASASQLPLVYVPLESIMSKWVGDSEKRLDTIFDVAAKLGKSIVFLDEIDAFAGSRDKGDMPEYTRRLLSVMLRQMQGLVDTSNVVIIGATNRKADLDPALLSRFTRSIFFPLPNVEERAAIIGYYAKHLSLEERMALAPLCEGRAGREIEDGCGTAERMWATELVTSRAAASAPPVDRYAGAFRLKFG
jgi:hypothetical protein